MKPKIAWVVYDLPYPLTSGGKMRAFNLIKCLSRDFEIHLFSFYRRENQLVNREYLRPYVAEMKFYKRRWVWDLRNLLLSVVNPMPLLNVSYLDGRLRNDLRNCAAAKQFDLYHFEFLGTASYLPLVAQLGGRTVMGNENVEFEIYKTYAEKSKALPLIPLFKFDVAKMNKFERRLWNTADANIAVSQKDARVVQECTGQPCAVVPNAVEVKGEYPLKRGTSPTAFFSGDLNYRQNRDAVTWFCQEIAPLVRRSIPDFRLLVLSNSRPSFIKSYRQYLEVVGDENTKFDDVIHKASIFVSPIRIKSGTNLKVLQAAACGLPIIGTPASFVGYDFEPGEDVLVSGSAPEFAAKTVELLENSSFGEKLAKNAFAKVGKYSWENSARILKDVYRQVLY